MATSPFPAAISTAREAAKMLFSYCVIVEFFLVALLIGGIFCDLWNHFFM